MARRVADLRRQDDGTCGGRCARAVGRRGVHAARRRPHVDRDAAESRVVLQGPYSIDPRGARSRTGDSALARGCPEREEGRRRRANGRRSCLQRADADAHLCGADRPVEWNGRHHVPRRSLCAAGDVERSRRRDSPAAAPRRRDVRPQISARRIRPSGPAAGCAARRSPGSLAGGGIRCRPEPDRRHGSVCRRPSGGGRRDAVRRARRKDRRFARCHQRTSGFHRAPLSGHHHERPVRACRFDAQPARSGAATAMRDRLSVETQVLAKSPPAFIVHSAEDKSVPLENSVAFYQALRRAGVSAELHLYERGEHGFGTRADLGTTSGWTARWLEWMRAHGWLPAAPGATSRGRERGGDLGPRLRRPAQGRSRQRSVPQPHPRRRSSGPLDPARRRRLLHDVLVVRRVSRPGDLALARSRQLAAGGADALQECRLGLGARSREASGPLLHLLSRAHRHLSIELCRVGGFHSRTMERADRSEDRADRSRTRRRSRRHALPVPQRRESRASRCRMASRSPAR